ncbi:MAG: HEAT repeat domain-containing protein [Planctomycetales bacterium]
MLSTVTCHCGTKFDPPADTSIRHVNCPNCAAAIFLSAPASASDDDDSAVYEVSRPEEPQAAPAATRKKPSVPGWLERYKSSRDVKKGELQKTLELIEKLARIDATSDPLGAALYLSTTHSDAETSVASLLRVAISDHPVYTPLARTFLDFVGPTDSAGAQQVVNLLNETQAPPAVAILCACLRRLGPTPVVHLRSLIDILKGKQTSIFIWAVHSLRLIGPGARGAVEVLLKTLKLNHPELRLAVIDALGGIARDPQLVLPVLLQALQLPAADIRAHAAVALGRFGGAAAAAVGPLNQLLLDSDPAVRQGATEALQAIKASLKGSATGGAGAGDATKGPDAAGLLTVPCGCGKKLRVKAEYAGRKVKCPACQQPVMVPVPAAKEAAPEEKTCPDCLASVPAKMVLCVHCGLDFRTGKKLGA